MLKSQYCSLEDHNMAHCQTVLGLVYITPFLSLSLSLSAGLCVCVCVGVLLFLL